MTLAPGDIVIMFTDGVSEATNAAGEEFGEERIIALARECAGLPAANSIDRIMGALDSFTAGAPLYDDITLLVLCVKS